MDNAYSKFLPIIINIINKIDLRYRANRTISQDYSRRCLYYPL